MNLLHTETVTANYVHVTNVNNFKAGKIADSDVDHRMEANSLRSEYP